MFKYLKPFALLFAGQTFENWIRLSPLAQTRTEAVKVLIISSQDKVHSSRMVRKPKAMAKCSRQESEAEAAKAVSEVEKVPRSPRPPFPPSSASLQAQKKQQENEATASGSGRRPASTIVASGSQQSYNHMALGAVLGAILCVLLGAGVAILCMIRCLPKKYWLLQSYKIYQRNSIWNKIFLHIWKRNKFVFWIFKA